DSPFDTAGAVGLAIKTALVVAQDLVVRLGAPLRRERESVSDLDAFHRLRPHESCGDARVETLVFGGVRAEPWRNATRAHLDDAPDRVTRGPRLLDALLEIVAEDFTCDLDADRVEQCLRDAAGGDDHGGLARARTLEGVPHVRKAELQRPCEIGVTRTWERHRRGPLAARLAIRRPRIHPPLPVRVITVANDECERRAEGPAVAQAGEGFDLVVLDLLPR